MAVLIHREIKDELVIPLALISGAISYPDFIEKQVDVETGGETETLNKDGKVEKVTVKVITTETVREKVEPPSFEKHLSALSQYLSKGLDVELAGYINRLAEQDPEVLAKKAELEELINSKKKI